MNLGKVSKGVWKRVSDQKAGMSYGYSAQHPDISLRMDSPRPNRRPCLIRIWLRLPRGLLLPLMLHVAFTEGGTKGMAAVLQAELRCVT